MVHMDTSRLGRIVGLLQESVGELSQCLCYDDSTINIVVIITISHTNILVMIN